MKATPFQEPVVLGSGDTIINYIPQLGMVFPEPRQVGQNGKENHFHVLLRLDPDVANGWSDEEVVRRWGRLFPARNKSRQPLPVTGRVGSMAARGPSMGGNGSRAVAKPQLVHEVPQRTWEAISFWSITPGGSFARQKPRSRRSWPVTSIGWEAVPRPGGGAWRNSARADCSAASSPPAMRSCVKPPNA